MVLDIPGGLFGQEDVREADAGGITSANFNSTDFNVSLGIVNLKNKTSFWSCTGDHFMSANPDTDQITYGGDSGTVDAEANGISFSAPVFLPDKVVVTKVIVFGDAAAAAETYVLERFTLSSAATATMASANINTEDTTISNATIDNNTFAYHLTTTSLDTNDTIFGARITYTTDYD